MNLRIPLICILFMALFIHACVSEFNPDLPAGDNEILVVTGNIIGDTTVTFYLSKSFALDKNGVPAESRLVDADIIVQGTDGFMSEHALSLGNGAYQIRIGHLNEDALYSIIIACDGEVYQSTPSKPVNSGEIDSVSFKQFEKGSDVNFRISAHDDNSKISYYMWNYEEDWEINSYYYTTIFFDDDKEILYKTDFDSLYYCWKNNRTNKILIGTTESLTENKIINKQLFSQASYNDRFSVLYSLKVSQQGISRVAYEFYLNKQKLNEQMGGLFTPQPSELGGNVICMSNPQKKALGYVEVSKNISYKRIFVSRSEISKEPFYSKCELLTPDSVSSILEEDNITIADFYRQGWRPVSTDVAPDWARDICVDCISNGGVKKKPDFWPNDHK